MNVEELTNQIYDTLLQNVGMSEYHIALDINQVTNQLCDIDRCEIYLEIQGSIKRTYKIKITQTNFDW